MRDFQEYVTLFAKGVLQYSGDELVQYLHDVDKELDGITCLDGSIWTHIHREKALSERCRTSPMHCIDQKRERKSAAVLNTFMKSNTQQSILKQRHGTEYGSTSNPRDAWIPDDVLQENGPEIALFNGDKVRVKTWNWTEPVSAEEVLEDTLQARTMRNAPVDGKLPFGSTEPMENIVYYDDLADHDFPDDSEISLDDSAVLPGMEVRDEDTLDAYFDVTSEVLPMEAIRNYTIEIYSMPGRRTDSFDLGKPPKRPKHSSSRLKPTERDGTSRQWENVVGPVSPIPGNRAGPS
ncbi:hypothetical protein R1sor_011887 [Riccia sorocarpa]|uniref:Uncharacterized protein n=1 Tax=Riccia sorocarpa TaxID=122646 RepID=A0ABD3I6H6_9MARC